MCGWCNSCPLPSRPCRCRKRSSQNWPSRPCLQKLSAKRHLPPEPSTLSTQLSYFANQPLWRLPQSHAGKKDRSCQKDEKRALLMLSDACYAGEIPVWRSACCCICALQRRTCKPRQAACCCCSHCTTLRKSEP